MSEELEHRGYVTREGCVTKHAWRGIGTVYRTNREWVIIMDSGTRLVGATRNDVTHEAWRLWTQRDRHAE